MTCNRVLVWGMFLSVLAVPALAAQANNENPEVIENLSTAAVNVNSSIVALIVAFLGLAATALPSLPKRIKGYVAAAAFLVGIVGAVALAIALRSATAPPEGEYESAQDLETAAPSPPETRTETYSFNRINSHCSGAREVRWRVNAPDGWRIVGRDSIDDDFSESSKSTYHGVQDLDDSGFFVTGTVANNGNCVKALGQTIARDARGRLYAFGTYDIERVAD